MLQGDWKTIPPILFYNFGTILIYFTSSLFIFVFKSRNQFYDELNGPLSSYDQPQYENKLEKLDNSFHPRFQQQHKDYFLKQDDRFLQDEQLSPEQALKRDPHHYRPLPLPLRDAIRYVKLYGKHSDMLKDYHRTSRYHDIGRHQRKRSQLQCKNNPRQKSESS